jgi:hypothetical protein
LISPSTWHIRQLDLDYAAIFRCCCCCQSSLAPNSQSKYLPFFLEPWLISAVQNPRRGYYRCTHRHSQGCPATKQVQRTDEDPTVYDVIYHGGHTCVHRAAAGQAQATAPPEHRPDAHGHLRSLGAGLTVKTETEEGLPAAAPLCLSASTPPVSGGGCPCPCLAPSTPENWGVSPASSNSNHAASYLPFEDAEWRGHAGLQEVVSASAPPPPAVDSLDDLLLLVDIDDIASLFD